MSHLTQQLLRCNSEELLKREELALLCRCSPLTPTPSSPLHLHKHNMGPWLLVAVILQQPEINVAEQRKVE